MTVVLSLAEKEAPCDTHECQNQVVDMISNEQIAELVKAGVKDVIPSAKVSRVDVQEDIDSSDEHPSLVILVVFSKRPPLRGEDFFSLHQAIQNHLLRAGEIRYPLLRYVGEKELRAAVS